MKAWMGWTLAGLGLAGLGLGLGLILAEREPLKNRSRQHEALLPRPSYPTYQPDSSGRGYLVLARAGLYSETNHQAALVALLEPGLVITNEATNWVWLDYHGLEGWVRLSELEPFDSKEHYRELAALVASRGYESPLTCLEEQAQALARLARSALAIGLADEVELRGPAGESKILRREDFVFHHPASPLLELKTEGSLSLERLSRYARGFLRLPLELVSNQSPSNASGLRFEIEPRGNRFFVRRIMIDRVHPLLRAR